MREPRPNWFPLRVNFKILDTHPHPFLYWSPTRANAGLTNREIMAISGHCSESSLQSYHNMSSVQQLRKCSNVLTVALGDDRVQATSDQLVGNERRPPLQQLQVPFVNTAISFFVQSDIQSMHDCNVQVYNLLQAVND